MTGKNKTWIIIGTILAILLIGAAIAWVMWKKKKDNNQSTSTNKPIKKPLPTVQAKPAPVQVQRQNA